MAKCGSEIGKLTMRMNWWCRCGGNGQLHRGRSGKWM